MQELPYQLERTVVIQAKPETVFRFFTDSARWASWWGAGSTIDAKPGGMVRIRHPNGVETVGQVLEITAGERIVFTYGYASGKPIPPGSSRVTIRLEAIEAGTRLHLQHEFAESGARDEHLQGWRFQLSLFGNVVANEVFADAASAIDAWYDAWNLVDAAARDEILTWVASPTVRFRDRFSLLDGAADISAHISAAQRFMPGIRLARKGSVRHCQGMVLADWVATDASGQVRMSGSSVYAFRADGKIDAVTGFSNG